MSITTTRAATPVEQIRNQLIAMTPEFKNALPSHIKPEKFQRVIMTVVQQNAALLNADRRTLFASCIKCAADGLIPDGREAALVMFGNQVQYMPMLAGIQKRVRNSGEIASIQAHVIYENDRFVIRRGIDETIEHEPKFPGDRGKPIGAYALARFKDGSDPVFEVMDVDAIERVRAISKAKNNGPWVQWWDEMARKTVFRRLSKWLPMDAESDELIRRDDETGAPTEIVEAPGGPTIEGDAFQAASAGTVISNDGTQANGETGEIVDVKVEDKKDADPAADLIASYAGCETQMDIQATDANSAVQSVFKKLSPADQKRVNTAKDDRLKALKEGASQ